MGPRRRDKQGTADASMRPLYSELFVTDHPDNPGEPQKRLRDLYGKLAALGFTSVRYDWRWAAIEPQRAAVDRRQAAHYGRVKKAMDAAGLGAPTVVLSTPPAWAWNLYKTGETAAFFAAYKDYVELVACALRDAGGEPVRTVQVLNELNNRLYTRIKPNDIAALCAITREAFRPYCGEVRLLATVLVLPARPLVSSVLPFLRRHREVLEPNFDSIGADYYPGVWHWPSLRDIAASVKARQGVREMVPGNMRLLEAVYRELAAWRLDYELTEVGWTSHKFFGGEAAQAGCFTMFFRAYNAMVTRLPGEGCSMPRRVGLYAARDESTAGLLRYAIRRQRWGLYDDALRAKPVADRLAAVTANGSSL